LTVASPATPLARERHHKGHALEHLMSLCLVLNASLEPLSILPAMRGFALVRRGKVDVIEADAGRVIRWQGGSAPMPVRVVLREYLNLGARYHAGAGLSKRNLLLRDAYTCQYCGAKEGEGRRGARLTWDHVLPQSRGGQNTWENLVTACTSCNSRKGNRTPSEAGMPLQRLPRRPRKSELLQLRADRCLPRVA
jgi:hypothetical protein